MPVSMSELETMRREWVQVTRKNGFQDGITDLLAHQYSKKTHFIFELLQNAEDAAASEVEFHVENERLVFSHNGDRLFTDENVESITSIGRSTKQTDYTQIGKHGIGFKAVFAYTHTPRIHSGDKHFEIEDVVVPRLLTGDEVPADMRRGETRIILPFDSQEIPESHRFRDLVPASSALADISGAMRQFSVRTLLFLRNINSIRWTLPDGTGGTYLRQHKPHADKPALRHVILEDGSEPESPESWVVFEGKTQVSDNGKNHKCTVEVAFLIRGGKVVQARDTELVVYFPTEKKTELGFLIQGPFKTTKARDNIAQDSRPNQQLIEAAAQLVADSLEDLRDRGLLDASSYLAFPIRVHDFPESSFFRVVYDKVRDALKTKPLLPADGGGFVKAAGGKLAGASDLVDLFSPQQLVTIFKKADLKWLDRSITAAGQLGDLHAYLVGRKQGQEWRIEPVAEKLQVEPEALVDSLTAEFLAAQDVGWLKNFIAYAKDNQAIRKTPFVRLEDGHQVHLPVQGKQPKAYLAPDDASGVDLSDFPLVNRLLVEDEDVKTFLQKAGIREVDKVAIVERCILPKYPLPVGVFEESDYRDDLQRIHDALVGSASSTSNTLAAQARRQAWVACVDASGTHPEKVAWKLPDDKAIFRRSKELEEWFAGTAESNYFFLHRVADEQIETKLRASFGIANGSLIKRSPPNFYCRSEGGFYGDADIAGLVDALRVISNEKARYLWGILLEQIPLIRGKELRSGNRQFPANSTWEVNISPLGTSCTEHAWLPTRDDPNFYRPKEILLSQLPDDFESSTPRAEALSRALGMKQPVDLTPVVQAWGMTEDQIEQRRELTDEEVNEVLKRRSEARDFPDKKSPVSDRRREKVREKAREAPRKTSSQREQSVQDGYSEDKAEAKEYLRSQYTALDENLFCQLGHKPMPFKLINSEDWHFEAVECVSDTLCRYPENFLALSPHYAALFKYANHDRDRMRDLIRNTETQEIQLRLAEETCTLRFTSQHLDDLKSVLDVDTEEANRNDGSNLPRLLAGASGDGPCFPPP
jgi:hypothetical protein